MQVSEDVLRVLSMVTINGKHVTFGQVERKLYLKVNETLEAAGGVWNKKAKAPSWVNTGSAMENQREASCV